MFTRLCRKTPGFEWLEVVTYFLLRGMVFIISPACCPYSWQTFVVLYFACASRFRCFCYFSEASVSFFSRVFFGFHTSRNWSFDRVFETDFCWLVARESVIFSLVYSGGVTDFFAPVLALLHTSSNWILSCYHDGHSFIVWGVLWKIIVTLSAAASTNATRNCIMQCGRHFLFLHRNTAKFSGPEVIWYGPKGSGTCSHMTLASNGRAYIKHQP